MNHALFSCFWLALVAVPPVVAETPRPPTRINLSVRDADLKDVLRAATEGTDLNLTFDPTIDTRIKGMELKGMTLEELLDQVLPSFGLGYRKTGRTLHVHKSDGGLTFYDIDFLSVRRTGKKEFSVNASGQLIQTGATGGGAGGGGGQGSSSAYTSSLHTAGGGDPWEELESGLNMIIFGGGSATTRTDAPPSSQATTRDGKSLLIQPDSGLVGVGADPGTQLRVARYLEVFRRRHARQVILEAKIVEVTLGTDSQAGVNWSSVLSNGTTTGGPGTSVIGSFTPGDVLNASVAPGLGVAQLVVSNARVTAAISALARDSRLKVLSSPRISTMNNQKAILRVVQEEPFFLQNSQTSGTGGVGGFSSTINITPMIVPVGIILDIQPQISADGTITLAVNPSVSEVVNTSSLNIPATATSGGAQATLPVVNRRDLDTVVRMRTGETLVLAGIIQTKESLDNRGVPFLARLPLIGGLFSQRERSKNRTELAIFITPTLVEDSAQVNAERERTERRMDEAERNLKFAPKGKPAGLGLEKAGATTSEPPTARTEQP